MTKRDTLFIVIILAMSVFMVRACNNYKDLERVVESSQDEASQWRDKEGRARAKIADVSGELSTLKITHKEELDSIRKEIGGLRKLRSATTLNETISGGVETILERDTLRDTVIMADTVYVMSSGRRFKHEDIWVSIWGVVNDSSIFVNYSIDNEIRLIRRDERYGRLKTKKRTIVEAVSLNPNSTLTGISQITVEPKKKNFSLGIGIGYGLSDRLTPTWNVGLQLHYTLWRF